MDSQEEKLNKMVYDLEILQLRLDSAAKEQDLQKINDKLKEFVPMTRFKKMAEDMNETIKKQDLEVLAREI